VIILDRWRIHDNLLVHLLCILRIIHVAIRGLNNARRGNQLDHWTQARVSVAILNMRLRRVSSHTLDRILNLEQYRAGEPTRAGASARTASPAWGLDNSVSRRGVAGPWPPGRPNMAASPARVVLGVSIMHKRGEAMQVRC
jgi:hypothetical protein